ncbi:hypothetical protein [Gordonibacter sp.]|uniref:hypothetical protein n=1 Tax=Gordonibacter sp. TaxID=1968902 RepID=UPI002FC5984E
MATLVTLDAVAISLDHLRVFGNGNVEFMPLEDGRMDLCAGPMWKKSKETENLTSFFDFIEKACVNFTKEHYLSRTGDESLPWAND